MRDLPDQEFIMLMRQGSAAAHIGFFDGILTYVMPVKLLLDNNFLFISPLNKPRPAHLSQCRDLCLEIDGQTADGASYTIFLWGTCSKADRNHLKESSKSLYKAYAGGKAVNAPGPSFQRELLYRFDARYKKISGELKKDLDSRSSSFTSEKRPSLLTVGI